ncbi:MAG: hypothetical protein ACE5D1_02300, partial [Fidelibacterota bacterium]
MKFNPARIFGVGIGVILALLISCEIPPDDPGEQVDPESLFLGTSADTVLVLSGDQTPLDVYGVFFVVSSNTIRNAGILVDTSYLVISRD